MKNMLKKFLIWLCPWYKESAKNEKRRQEIDCELCTYSRCWKGQYHCNKGHGIKLYVKANEIWHFGPATDSAICKDFTKRANVGMMKVVTNDMLPCCDACQHFMLYGLQRKAACDLGHKTKYFMCSDCGKPSGYYCPESGTCKDYE